MRETEHGWGRLVKEEAGHKTSSELGFKITKKGGVDAPCEFYEHLYILKHYEEYKTLKTTLKKTWKMIQSLYITKIRVIMQYFILATHSAAFWIFEAYYLHSSGRNEFRNIWYKEKKC